MPVATLHKEIGQKMYVDFGLMQFGIISYHHSGSRRRADGSPAMSPLFPAISQRRYSESPSIGIWVPKLASERTHGEAKPATLQWEL